VPIIDVNFGHVHAGNVEHRIGPGAPAQTRATHTVGHRRGLRQRAWSLLILKASTPSPHDQHANRELLTHAHLRRPVIGHVKAALGYPYLRTQIGNMWNTNWLVAKPIAAGISAPKRNTDEIR
jgi:hypothetical protein